MFNLGEAILALLEIVFGFWNNQVSLVFELLGQSPTGFKGGGPWGIIEGIEPLFVGIGSALVVLFFVIGFCGRVGRYPGRTGLKQFSVCLSGCHCTVAGIL